MDISNVYFGDTALSEILNGVDTLAHAVKSTMGPSGGTVIIDRPGKSPHLTKDGVTVAKSINLKNIFTNTLTMQLLKRGYTKFFINETSPLNQIPVA